MRSLTRLAALSAVTLLVVACGPAASPASPTVAPSAAASPSIAASPSLAASPSAVAGGPIVELAVAKLNARPFRAHVEEIATAETTPASSSGTVNVTMAGDFNDQDLSVHLSGTSAGTVLDLELAVVGDTAWVRQGSAAWTSAPRSSVASSLESMIVALQLVHDPKQLQEVGIESVDGQSLHHLTKAADIPYTVTTGTIGSYDALDLWVRDDGTPVKLTARFTGKQGSVTASGTIEVRFSRFGETIEIKPPEAAPSA